MPGVLRYATIEVSTSDGKSRKLRLKKWSATKLLHLIRELGEVIDEVIGGIGSLDQLNEFALISNMIKAFGNLEDRAVWVIKQSLDEDVSEEEILSLYPEDFLKVLHKIFEMNITEELLKNAQRLISAMVGEMSGSGLMGDQKAPKKTEA